MSETMKAFVVREFGTPVLGEFIAPAGSDGYERVAVLAAGVNHLDLAKATGRFYDRTPEFPFVVGSDGVGRRKDGRRVYFDAAIAPYGSMAEHTLVDPTILLPVHDDVPDTLAAAVGNAGVAAMIALTRHATLQSGERVVILGATGAVGRIAVQVARSIGAASVVGVARNEDRLGQLAELGATGVISLDTEDLTSAIVVAAGGRVDVVLDMLGGETAAAAIAAMELNGRFVQIGAKAGPVIALPAALLRSRLLTLRGTSGGQEPREARASAYSRLQELLVAGDLVVDVTTFALSDVMDAWDRQRAGAASKLLVLPQSVNAE